MDTLNANQLADEVMNEVDLAWQTRQYVDHLWRAQHDLFMRQRYLDMGLDIQARQLLESARRNWELAQASKPAEATLEVTEPAAPELTEREAELVAWCRAYAHAPAGLPGHALMLIVAKLFDALTSQGEALPAAATSPFSWHIYGERPEIRLDHDAIRAVSVVNNFPTYADPVPAPDDIRWRPEAGAYDTLAQEIRQIQEEYEIGGF